MPRYYFHLTDGISVEDIGGETFALAAEARGHAVKVAKHLERSGLVTGSTISVTDETGVVVFTKPITNEE